MPNCHYQCIGDKNNPAILLIHGLFGEGDNLKLYINFEDYGSKWLVMTYAHLEIIK